MCRLSWNLGASTSCNPQGLSRPVMGLLYLYCEIVLVSVINEAERHYTILSSFLSVVCNHLELGLWILEVDPVYCYSFQLMDHACSKTGRSGITVVTEILWFVTANLGEWHCSCCHHQFLILCCLLQIVSRDRRSNISCHFVLRIAFMWGVNQCCFVDRYQQLKRTYMPHIQERSL